MTKFFVLIFAIAAAVTVIKYTIKVEGTFGEKLNYLCAIKKKSSSRKVKYAGRHRYIKRLNVRYAV